MSPSTLPDPRRLVLRHVRPHPQFVVSLVTPARPVSAAARAFVDMAAVDTH